MNVQARRHECSAGANGDGKERSTDIRIEAPAVDKEGPEPEKHEQRRRKGDERDWIPGRAFRLGAFSHFMTNGRPHSADKGRLATTWRLPAQTELVLQAGEERAHRLHPRIRHGTRGLGVQLLGDEEELLVEVIEPPGLVVRQARAAERVVAGVERPPHLGASGEAAGDPDGADRVEAIGVLEDPALDGAWQDSPRERMHADGLADRLYEVLRASFRDENHPRMLGTNLTREMGLGVTLGVIEQLMQEGGGNDDRMIGPFRFGDAPRRVDDASNVEKIVRRTAGRAPQLGDRGELLEEVGLARVHRGRLPCPPWARAPSFCSEDTHPAPGPTSIVRS